MHNARTPTSLLALACFAGTLIVLPSCGDRKPAKAPLSIESGLEGLYRYAGTRLDEHVKSVASLVKKDLERGIPLLMERLKQERTDPKSEVVEFRIDKTSRVDPQSASVLLNDVQQVMAARLRCYGYPGGSFSVSRGVVELRLPRGSMEGDELDGFMAALIARMTSRGTVSIRLERLPPESSNSSPKDHTVRIATWRPGLDAYLPNLGGREGTKDTKKEDEAARDREEEAVSYYEPKGDVPAFLERGGISVRTRTDQRSRSNVIEIRPLGANRDAFVKWTTRYRNYKVLLLVEGAAEARSTLVDRGEPLVSFEIPQTREAAEFIRRQMLKCRVTCGELPIAIVGREIRHRPEVPNPPIARVLAEVGPAADRALLAFEPESGDLAHVVKWIRDEITRRATETTGN